MVIFKTTNLLEFFYLQDIKATHVAIEAPFQILLKLTMISMNILPLPGSENVSIRNGFGVEINLSWFPIVSTCLSVIGILSGALWIIEPVENETHFIIGKATFLPIFFFRMLIWLIFLIVLHSFSVFACFAFAGLNMLILLLVQEQLGIDPLSHSLLSIIFPVHKMPSSTVDPKISMKILFWMVLAGNSALLLSHACVYGLFHFNVYNPWCSDNAIKLLIPMDKFQSINPLVATLYFGATLPILVVYFAPSYRYLCYFKLKNIGS